MTTENIYTNEEVSQLLHLQEVGININNYEMDGFLVEAVDARSEEIIRRMDHIQTTIYQLDYELRDLQELLNERLYDLIID